MSTLRRFKPYPAYKDSGVEGLGEIPEHWEALKLKRVCAFLYGESLASDARTDGEIQVYGSNGPVGMHDRANTLAPCLVIGRKGSFGKVNYSADPVFAIDTTFFVDHRATHADLRWLYYALTDARLDAATKDSAIPGLDREDAYARDVSSPPEPEQRAIAAFLDCETAKIDALVAKKERLIELLQEKRTALITRAVTKGLDSNAPMKDSGVEWLGEIPVGWEVRRLRSTVTSCQNGVWGDEPEGVDDIACVRVADFDRVAFTVEIEEPTMRSIDPAVVAARGLRPGNLLLEKSGGGENQPVGAVVLFDHQLPAVCSNFVARVTIADGHDSRYQTYLHAALYAQRINTRHIKQSTGIQNLDSSSYLSEAMGLPPEPEQRAIAAFLDRETAKLDALVAKVRDAIERLKELRTALISAAVTGKIDVREEAP